MRKNRLVHPGLPHHVYARGNNRRCLFSYPRDYLRFIWYLHRALIETGCRLHALALMVNHVHLIVTPPRAEDLPRLVHYFGQRYAVYRNGSRDGTGKVFEERYRAKPITNDEYLATATAYVEMNPVVGGIVAQPGDYRWSTYGLHTGQANGDGLSTLWTPSEWYLALGDDPETRATRYAESVDDYRRNGKRPEYIEELEAFEAAAARYTRRLQRPDGTSAREPGLLYRAIGFAGENDV
jgi:putative transposase